MKKAIVSFMIIIIAILGTLNSYAASTTANIELNLTGPATVKQEDKTVTLTLSLGDFTEIQDNCVLGYEATLEYDKNMFEGVAVKGLSGWTSNYNDSTKILIGDTSSAKANTKITEIVLTLKEGVQSTTTDIKLNNIILTNDENDFEYNKKVTVAVQKQESTNTTNNTTNNTATNSENKNTSSNQTMTSGKNTDTTTASTNIPAAGTGMVIIVGIFILIMIGLISGKSYISYLKDTNKQLKK